MPRELLVQVSPEVAHHDEQLYPHIAKLIQIPVQDIQRSWLSNVLLMRVNEL